MHRLLLVMLVCSVLLACWWRGNRSLALEVAAPPRHARDTTLDFSALKGAAVLAPTSRLAAIDTTRVTSNKAAAALAAPLETWLTRDERQKLLDRVAVAYIGGAGRASHGEAAAQTWLTCFPSKLFVTDVSAKHASVPETLRNSSINRFVALGQTDDEVALNLFPPGDDFWTLFKTSEDGHVVPARQPTSKGWNLGWYLAQAKYLFGLNALVAKHPHSDWFLLADSDTYVFADRLAQGVLAKLDATDALALGSYWIYPPSVEHRQVRDTQTTNGLFLGGAGVLVSRGALRRLNLTACLQHEHTQSNVPADWRVTMCLRNAGVSLVDVPGLQQTNLEGGCNPQGSAACRKTLYFSIYEHRTTCPYTVHYTQPERMLFFATLHGRAPRDAVCVLDPANVTQCLCSPGVDENNQVHGAWQRH
jgi:hypothetical protein